MTAPAAAPALDDRLDRIAAQLEAVTQELAAQRQERERRQDLGGELVPIARGALDVATRELEDLERDVTAEELAEFARTLVRAVPKLQVALVMLESFVDLIEEATALGGAEVGKLSDTLAAAERRGYFTAARGGGAVLDRVVQSVTEDDLRALADSVEPLLAAVRELAGQPVAGLLQRTAAAAGRIDEVTRPPSALGLLKALRDPEVRLGTARLLLLLRAVGQTAAPTPKPAPSAPPER